MRPVRLIPILMVCFFANVFTGRCDRLPRDEVFSSETQNQAEELAVGMPVSSGGAFSFNRATQRLEVRDSSGLFLDEMPAGTVGKAVDAGGQEYRVSFGKDDAGRLSVLVRPGPAMRRPVTLDLLGRKSVLSPDSSLTATLIKNDTVVYEASICGQVYYIDDLGSLRGRFSRRAQPTREIAVLAEPASLTPGSVDSVTESEEKFEGMNQAGETMKSAFLTFFGLPDKQPTPKAKVYRLKGGSGRAGDPNPTDSSQTTAR